MVFELSNTICDFNVPRYLGSFKLKMHHLRFFHKTTQNRFT